jgi:hypothetical protein
MDKQIEIETKIHELVQDCPTVFSSRQKNKVKLANDTYNQLLMLMSGNIWKTIRSLDMPSHTHDDLFQLSYIVLGRAIATWCKDKYPSFRGYFLKSLKRQCLRYNKHNKSSFFTREEGVIVFSLDAQQEDKESIIGSVDCPHELLDKRHIIVESRFTNEDELKQLKDVGTLIEQGIDMKDIRSHIKTPFLLDWMLFKIKEYIENEEKGIVTKTQHIRASTRGVFTQ